MGDNICIKCQSIGEVTDRGWRIDKNVIEATLFYGCDWCHWSWNITEHYELKPRLTTERIEEGKNED